MCDTFKVVSCFCGALKKTETNYTLNIDCEGYFLNNSAPTVLQMSSSAQLEHKQLMHTHIIILALIRNFDHMLVAVNSSGVCVKLLKPKQTA